MPSFHIFFANQLTTSTPTTLDGSFSQLYRFDRSILPFQVDSIQNLAIKLSLEESMATDLKQVLDSTFPDEATFMRAVQNALNLPASTSSNPEANSFLKPQAHGGVAKTKKKTMSAKSTKEKTTRSVKSSMMFRCK